MNGPLPPPGFTGLWTSRQPCGGRIEIEYLDGVRNGICRHWNREEICIREGTLKNGQRHGPLITRSADGTELDVSEFEDGTGIYRIFYSNHQLSDEIPMRHGVPHGIVRHWRRGKLFVTQHYDDGVCIAATCDGP